MRGAGLEHGRGAHARLHEPRGARAHARQRRDPLLEPLARGALAQGRDLGQRAAVRSLRYDCDADALLALVEPAGPGLSHGRADLLLPHARRAAGSPCTRRCPRSRARSPSASGAARGQLHGRAAARRPAERSARRSRRRRRRSRARRATSRTQRVREEAADVLYHLGVLLEASGPAFCRRARRADGPHGLVRASAADGARDGSGLPLTPDARRGSRAGARPQRDPAPAHLHRRLRDAGVGVPEAARPRPRVPARVGRAGPALRPLLVPRLPAARDPALRGRAASRAQEQGERTRARREPTRSPRSPTTCRPTASRRSTTCRRSRAAPSACSDTTWCARSSACRSRTPTTSARPTWR